MTEDETINILEEELVGAFGWLARALVVARRKLVWRLLESMRRYQPCVRLGRTLSSRSGALFRR